MILDPKPFTLHSSLTALYSSLTALDPTLNAVIPVPEVSPSIPMVDLHGLHGGKDGL